MQKVASRQNKGCGSDNRGGVRAEHCHLNDAMRDREMLGIRHGASHLQSLHLANQGRRITLRCRLARSQSKTLSKQREGGLQKHNDIRYSI